MEESTIWVYLDEDAITDEGLYCVTDFNSLLEPEWLDSEFATYCIEKIDGNKHVAGHNIISPYLGYISPAQLSGGTQTLLVAYNMKDLVVPLENIGDNCKHGLYLSGIGEPSKWWYDGYFPEMEPNQKVYFPELNIWKLGSEIQEFECTEYFDKWWQDSGYKDEPVPIIPPDVIKEMKCKLGLL